jgi:Xaa-Pro aminopeptidase
LLDRIENLRNLMRTREIDAAILTSWENIYYFTGLNFAMFEGQPALAVTQSDATLLYPSFWWMPMPEAPRIAASCYDLNNPPMSSKQDLARAIAKTCPDARRVGLEWNRASVLLHNELKELLQGSELTDLGGDLARFRMLKDSTELWNIKKASRICEAAMKIAETKIRPGLAERDLIETVDKSMRERGSSGFAFPTMIAAGKNALDPCWTGSSKKIGRTDLVYVDVGPMVNGYASDMTRTFFVGKVGKRIRNLYDAVRVALEECHDKGQAGMPARELDAVARDYVTKEGYGKYFIHPGGHGVGITVGEEPMLAPWSNTILEEGMTFTLEIGAYVPNVGGVRLEDTVYCEKDGLRTLTHYPCDQT